MHVSLENLLFFISKMETSYLPMLGLTKSMLKPSVETQIFDHATCAVSFWILLFMKADLRK